MKEPPVTFSKDLTDLIKQACYDAYGLGHWHVSEEHFLYTFLQHQDIENFLTDQGIDTADLFMQIDQHLSSVDPKFYGPSTSDQTDLTTARLRLTSKPILRPMDAFRGLIAYAQPNSYTSYLIEQNEITTEQVDTYMNKNLPMTIENDTTDNTAPETEKARNSAFHPEFEKDKIRKVLGLEDALKEKVIGQDEACKAIAKAFVSAAAQDAGRNKPIGSFLLNGPTGVGKTEIAKQLSEYMDAPLVRIDMSEYSEGHAVARLVGSPPGYIGHDDGGQLTNAILENPNAIVLLDEIEKAHPKTHKIFLQVMDSGKLTDSKGNVVDFSQATLLMTGNIGVTEAKKNGIGFTADTDEGVRYQAELESTFAPEFLNRLSAVIQFNGLVPEVMDKILDKMIGEMNNKYNDTEIVLSDEARADVSKRGFHPTMGARPMQRLLQNDVEEPIAEEILRSKLEDQAIKTVHVAFNDAANDNNDQAKGILTFAFEKESVPVQEPVAEQSNQSRPSSDGHDYSQHVPQ